MENLFRRPAGQDQSAQKALIELINQFFPELQGITEINQRELVAISMLETEPLFVPFVVHYKKNKKHLKRAHSAELLHFFETLIQAVTASFVQARNTNPFQGGP